MKAIRIACLFFCLLIFSYCGKEAVISPKSHPYVITLAPVLNDSSVVFSAKVLDPGPDSIIYSGFVWSKNHIPTIQDNHIFLDNATPGESYTADIHFGLTVGEHYFVRAFIKSIAYEVYGNSQPFVSKGSTSPSISGFTPDHGPMGTQVTVYGNNFGVINSELLVKFGDHLAVIDSAFEGRLVVHVPTVTQNELVPVTVISGDKSAVSASYFDIWFPWSHETSFQNMRLMSFASFAIDHKIYICGGAEFGFTGISYSVWQYDLETGIWQIIGDVPGDLRFNAVGFSLNGKGYYGLGARVDNLHNTYLTDLWEFDPTSNSWTLKTNYPDIPVTYQKTFIADEKVFIGPGLYWDGTQGHTVNHCWNYDPVQNAWSQKKDYPGAVETGMIGISAGSKGYLGLGGVNREIYEYDPVQDAWIVIPEYPGAATSYNAGFSINGNLYAGLGAIDLEYPENDMWQFDPSQNIWTAMQSCPTRLGPLFNFTIDNKGYTGMGYYAHNFADEIEGKFVYAFDPGRN